MRTTRTIAVLAFAAVMMAAPARAASDGALDPSFGNRGSVITSFGSGAGSEDAAKVLVLPDGRILTVGIADGIGVGVTMHLPNGSLDSSFDGDGKLFDQLAPGFSPFSAPEDAVQQPDGRIGVAGFLQDGVNPFDSALARYSPTGGRDAGFGNDPPNPSGDGLVQDDVGNWDGANGLALDAAGRLVTVGRTAASNMFGAPSNVYVARYNPDGSLDGSFGGTGHVITDPGTYDVGHSVAIQLDGRLVVTMTSDGQFIVLRLLPGGSPDPSFSGDGFAATGLSGDTNVLRVAIQPDGKIVIAGTVGSFPNRAAGVARLLANGEPDPSFGGGGTVTVPIAGADHSLGGLAITDDAKILVAGTAQFGTNPDLAVTRLLSDGRLDPQFGAGGVARSGAPTTSESGSSVAVQPNRRIVVGGSRFDAGEVDRLLLRLLGDTIPPDTKITSGPKGKIHPRSKARFRFKVLNDTSAIFECKLKRPRRHRAAHASRKHPKYRHCKSPKKYRGLKRPGKYLLRVRATDPAGNVDRTPAKRRFKVLK